MAVFSGNGWCGVWALITLLACFLLTSETEANFTLMADTVNWQDAITKCERQTESERIGSYILDNPDSVLDQLSEGGSAWISGSSKLSAVVTWAGCVERPNGIYVDMSILTNNGIFNCLDKCGVSYVTAKAAKLSSTVAIGLNGKKCLCFKKLDETIKYVSETQCNTSCYNITEDNCGSKQHAAMYKVVKFNDKLQIGLTTSISFLPKKPCFFITKLTSGQRALDAASCYLGRNSSMGYLCTESNAGALDCPTDESDHVTGPGSEPCLRKLSDHSNSWTAASKACRNMSGQLSDLPSSQNVEPLVDVWTGLFRAIKWPLQWGLGRTLRNYTCLSVVKVDGSLRLEPDACDVKKHYICRLSEVTYASPTPSSNVPSLTTIASSEASTENVPPKFSTSTLPHRKKQSHLVTIVAPVMAIVILGVSAAIIGYVVCRRKTNREKRFQSMPQQHQDTALDDPIITENPVYSGGQDVAAHSVITDHYDVIDRDKKVLSNYKYTSPEDTHTYSHARLDGEDDYDVLRSGVPHRDHLYPGGHKGRITTMQDSQGVYNHVGFQTEGDYNTLGEVRKPTITVPVDVYSTLDQASHRP